MTRLFFTLFFWACFLAGNGQEGERNLAFYMETARRHSPLLQDYRNRESVQRLERERLKSLYTRSRLELNGGVSFRAGHFQRRGTDLFSMERAGRDGLLRV